MRSRASHLACLLLLLSSLAVSGARIGGTSAARTPGGVFIHNLLLRAAVEETEPATSSFERNQFPVAAASIGATPNTHEAPTSAAHTAHVHAVTGSSL